MPPTMQQTAGLQNQNRPNSRWFMNRNRTNLPVRGTQTGGKFRNRSNEILFIDARNLRHLIICRTLELSNGYENTEENDIAKIAGTYHNWRTLNGNYEDIPGFCASAPIGKVKELDYVLTPGRSVGLPDDKDDFDFNERFTALKAEPEEQLKEEALLNKQITENLKKIKQNEEK